MAEDEKSVNGEKAVHRISVETNVIFPNEKERKKPFVIGVAGGTCCGKVCFMTAVAFFVCRHCIVLLCEITLISLCV